MDAAPVVLKMEKIRTHTLAHIVVNVFQEREIVVAIVPLKKQSRGLISE